MRLFTTFLIAIAFIPQAYAADDKERFGIETPFTDEDYAARQAAFQKRVNAIRRSDDEAGQLQAVEAAYRDFHSGPQPDSVRSSAAALRTAAQAADTAAFYTANPTHVMTYSFYIGELGRRGVGYR